MIELLQSIFQYPSVIMIFVSALILGLMIGIGMAVSGFSARDARLIVFIVLIYTIMLEEAHLHYRLALGHDFSITTPALGFVTMAFYVVGACVSWIIFKKKYEPIEISDEELKSAILVAQQLYDSKEKEKK